MGEAKWAFRFRQEVDDVVEIDIYDIIGDAFWFDTISAKDILAKLNSAKSARSIKLRVNSVGGDVFDGFAIYNLLKDHPARVEADVDGIAASIASVIIMAADEIRVAENSVIMIHNPWSFVVGESKDMRKEAEVLDKLRDQAVGVYAARTRMDRVELTEMMDAETWLTGEEAVENGFADALKPNKTPSKEESEEEARALAALDLSRFQNAPASLRCAVMRARRRMQVKPPPSPPSATPPPAAEPSNATPATAGAPPEKQERKRMTREELRAQHPELYAAVFNEGKEEGRSDGATQERKRVLAHLKLGKQTAAMDIAERAIAEGLSTMDEQVHADYMSAGLARREQGVREQELKEANAAADGANAPSSDEPKNLIDRAAAAFEASRKGELHG